MQIFLMENKFKNVWVTGINSLRDWMKNYEDGYITIRDFKNMHKKLGLQISFFNRSKSFPSISGVLHEIR